MSMEAFCKQLVNVILEDPCSSVGLPIQRVMSVEAFCKQLVNVILEDPHQINGVVLFEIRKQENRIKEGAVVHLSAQLNSLSNRINVALPDVLEHVVQFDRITWNELHTYSLMDRV